MRKYFMLILVFIIAIISLWLQEGRKKPQDRDSEASARFPDYFMENFTITHLDAQGLPSYTLKARKLRHYAEDNSSELEQANISFKQDRQQFTLLADRAVYVEGEPVIHLYDNVIIHRKGSAAQGELKISTDYLQINTQTQSAETERPAKVQTREAHLSTTGLLFDNQQGILKLKSQVKGLYAPAK